MSGFHIEHVMLKYFTNHKKRRGVVASVASVSARVRQECWDKSKKPAPAFTLQLDWKRFLHRPGVGGWGPLGPFLNLPLVQCIYTDWEQLSLVLVNNRTNSCKSSLYYCTCYTSRINKMYEKRHYVQEFNNPSSYPHYYYRWSILYEHIVIIVMFILQCTYCW